MFMQSKVVMFLLISVSVMPGFLMAASPDGWESSSGVLTPVESAASAEKKIVQTGSSTAAKQTPTTMDFFTDSPFSPAVEEKTIPAPNADQIKVTLGADDEEALTDSEKDLVTELALQLEKNVLLKEVVAILSRDGTGGSGSASGNQGQALSKEEKKLIEDFIEILFNSVPQNVPQTGPRPDPQTEIQKLAQQVMEMLKESGKPGGEALPDQTGNSAREDGGWEDRSLAARLENRQRQLFRAAVLLAVSRLNEAKESAAETLGRAVSRTREAGLHEDIHTLKTMHSQSVKREISLNGNAEDSSLSQTRELAAIVALLAPPKDIHPFLRVMFYDSNPALNRAYNQVRTELKRSTEKSQLRRDSFRSSYRGEEATLTILKKVFQNFIDYTHEWISHNFDSDKKSIPRILPQV